MRKSRTFNLLMALILAAAAVLNVQAAPVRRTAAPQGYEITRDTPFVPGEVVVGFPEGQSSTAYGAQASALAGSVGAQVVDRYGSTALLSFAEDADVLTLATQLSGVQGVRFAEPNYISWIPELDPGGNPNPTGQVVRTDQDGQRMPVSLEQLRGLRTIRRGVGVPTYPVEGLESNWGWWDARANIIWPNTAASPAVCVVDSGIDIKHPDLMGKAVNGLDFVNDDALADDDNGHGTHVAGTISAYNNNKKGLTGVSNGSVLAVKVLSAQGWGTNFDIAAGISYCANNLTVKVINLSLGGGAASAAEFAALDLAINTKGKFVVVAAGNNSTSDYFFPAAWAADFVCANGTDTFPAACVDNTIDQGMLAVGAARPAWSETEDGNNGGTVDGLLWVDTDGDGLEPADVDLDYWDEHFYPDDCAANFSNYAAWVEIVAPGEDIYSTLPVTYPFWDGYFYGSDGDGDGYDWWSGTSMAAPHVAGAAARTWSAFPLYTNAQIHNQLLLTPWPQFHMELASDPNISDPTAGYNDSGYQGEAPFCWPDAGVGAFYDMTEAVYLNVAAAMNRSAVMAEIEDAVTGLPLMGAYAYAYQGLTLKDKALVPKNDRHVELINLPAGPSYDIKVSKAGYTTGNANLGSIAVSTAGVYYSDSLFVAGIPPTGRITGVVNWVDDGIDLDLYTWIPNVSTAGAVVGPGNSGNGADVGKGELSAYPFARYNRDGGAYDWMGVESVSIVPRPGFPTYPYYNIGPSDFYDFLLTDYGSGDLNYPSGAGDVIFRLWRGGLPIVRVVKTDVCDSDGADDIAGNYDDEVFWEPLYLVGSTYGVFDLCGYADVYGSGGIWPYVDRQSGTSGAPERPTGTK